MKNYKAFLFFLFFLTPLSVHAEKLTVLVSIAPYKSICEQIGDDLVEVKILVPTGADSHNWEPSLSAALDGQKAKIWFCIGEPFETKLQNSLHDVKVVDLRKNLPLLTDKDHPQGVDPHIWMSPTLMIEQAKTIARALKEILPHAACQIEQNEQKVVEKLSTLDKKIKTILQDKKGQTIFSAHAAYNYFCHDYGLKVQTVEKEGKEPSVKELHQLIDEARNLKVAQIFVQSPSGHKGAQLVADTVGAKTVFLNPYDQDYFPMMEKTANTFAEAARP